MKVIITILFIYLISIVYSIQIRGNSLNIEDTTGPTPAVPENIYYFYFNTSQQSNFASFSLTQQKTVLDVAVPYTNNILIYSIVGYDTTDNSFLITYYNASTETDNIAYYSVENNQFEIISFTNNIIGGYYLTHSAPNFNFQDQILYQSILDFSDSNVTIFQIDFNKQTEKRIQFPFQEVRSAFKTPTGIYNQRVNYYYNYFLNAESNLPNILVYSCETPGNYSNFEFSDWPITSESQVYLLHTKNYVEGTLFALVIENDEISLYALSVFYGEAKQVLSWNIVPGSASLSNGIPFAVSNDYDNDYMVLVTQPSQDQYLYTTVDLWTLKSTSFTSSINLPDTLITYTV